MVQTSPSPYRAAQCLVETPLENQQLILPEDPCLSLALTRVNPWVYSHRGKRWPRKTVSFCLFSGGKQTWSVTSFSPSPLLVLHLINIYRIFASGIGNMEIKESRQCSLVLWDLGSNGSAQGCLWWPPSLLTLCPWFVSSCTITICHTKLGFLTWTVPLLLAVSPAWLLCYVG